MIHTLNSKDTQAHNKPSQAQLQLLQTQTYSLLKDRFCSEMGVLHGSTVRLITNKLETLMDNLLALSTLLHTRLLLLHLVKSLKL